ncbi:MAG: HAD family hydrolase, partial [Defluviitaleaceae bacterium]|nr:HAD family hydrolase [Defluviitaleaceae bacterium]
MTYDLLLTDLDGTLLNESKNISRQNRKAVKAAAERGKHIILCSGRSWASMAPFEQVLGLNKPGRYSAAFNGGAAYEAYSGTLLYTHKLGNALGKELICKLRGLGADIIAYDNGELIVDRPSQQIDAYSGYVKLEQNLVADLAELTCDYAKILAVGKHESLCEIREAMQPLFAGRCNIAFSARSLLEFAHVDAHKGTAVNFFSNFLKIPLCNIIAAGDQENDIPMIKAAGLGIAVA